MIQENNHRIGIETTFNPVGCLSGKYFITNCGRYKSGTHFALFLCQSADTEHTAGRNSGLKIKTNPSKRMYERGSGGLLVFFKKIF